MQDAGAGNAGDEYYTAVRASADHVLGTGLGDEEGAGKVYVEEGAEEGWGVGFCFNVGAGIGL